MNKNDLKLRIMVKEIFMALLSNNLSKNYFDSKLIEIFLKLLSNHYELPNFVETKASLLNYIKSLDLESLDDMELLHNIEYTNYLIIDGLINKDSTSLFSELKKRERISLIFVDLCCNSALKEIFYTEQFSFDDFFLITESVLGLKRKAFLNSLAKSEAIGFVFINIAQESLNTSAKFELELKRIFNIPTKFKSSSINDFEVDCPESSNLIKDSEFLTFTGDFASYYVYSKFLDENIRFWYIEDIHDLLELLIKFDSERIYDEFIWFDSPTYENNSGKEKVLLQYLSNTRTKIIVSTISNTIESFGTVSINVQFKESCIGHYVKNFFPKDLVCYLLDETEKIESSINKYEFIKEIKKIYDKNPDEKYLLKILPNYLNLFVKTCDDKSKKSITTVVDQKAYQARYNFDKNCTSPLLPVEYSAVNDIYTKLNSKPAVFLKANKDTLKELEKLLKQFPNVNGDKITLQIKASIMFSNDAVLNIKPLLFVGGPGTGKSFFAKNLSRIFGQDHVVSIPMSGGGQSALFGTPSDYKGAKEGKILSAIYEANENENLLNPVVILDELNQACFSSKVTDVNQNLLPSLLQLLGDENIKCFRDLFFDVPINEKFSPIFIATANSTENIPDPLLDRFNVVFFRDYEKEDLLSTVIPNKYEEFRKSHNQLVPSSLTQEELEIIYDLSAGKTRSIEDAIMRYLTDSFDINGQKKINLPSYTVMNTDKPYAHDILNTSVSLEKLIKMIENASNNQTNNGVRILLHGLPGTGKTEFVQYIAKKTGKKLLRKNASDILDCYVGETEKNTRRMFDEAQTTGNILLIDEADSFFRNRENADNSYEITHCNEFLTQMEKYTGILFCATNMIKIIDPAIQRRFHQFVEFKAISETGITKLLKMYFSKFDFTQQQINLLNKYNSVTPGDFSSLLGRIRLMEEDSVDSAYIINELCKIQEDKSEFRGTNVSKRIGFIIEK